MTEDDKRRQDDIIVAQLSQRFNDFVERYDRDCGAVNERDRVSKEWRDKVDFELKSQSKILEEISPAYNRGKWVVGLIMIGSIGIAIKQFWAHISFK